MGPELPVMLHMPRQPTSPFLHHENVPEDQHRVTFETGSEEYRVVVLLPGFLRHAM